MRIIKYKGKRLHINEWVYGSLYIRTIDGVMKYYIIENDKRPWRRVDPDTISEYTELKDKIGIEMYTGDTFQYRKHKGYIYDDFVGVVEFKKGSFGFIKNDTNHFKPFYEIDELQSDFLDHIEVIGNIHDKNKQKQALIDMMRGDEELGLYNEE